MEQIPEWVIVNRPGWVPERKGPLYKLSQIEDMLRRLYELFPDCTCTVLQMPITSYPQSGREWISEYGDKRRKKLPPYKVPS